VRRVKGEIHSSQFALLTSSSPIAPEPKDRFLTALEMNPALLPFLCSFFVSRET
jgi:hypothetical protein